MTYFHFIKQEMDFIKTKNIAMFTITSFTVVRNGT